MSTLDEDLIFYVAHYGCDRETVEILNICLHSIRKWYPLSDIIVCTSPPPQTIEGQSVKYIIPANTLVVPNPTPNSSCMGCFQDYLVRFAETKKKGIFIHDSIILTGRFDEVKLKKPFGFIWHFTEYYGFTSIEHPYVKEEAFNALVKYNLSEDQYYGCFGLCLYGSYESINKLCTALPFHDYLALADRKQVGMDLERLLAIVAFGEELLEGSPEECSLCGCIFKFPLAFQNWFTGQSYDTICKIPYKEPAVKIWRKRFFS